MIDIDKYWIWYKLLNIELKKKLDILKVYTSIEDIYRLTKEELVDKFMFNKKELEVWKNKRYLKKAELVDSYNRQKGIKILKILDEEYPRLLKLINYPPILLYYLGNKEILNNISITIFEGSNISKSGERLIKYLSKGLFDNNIKVVSRLNKEDKYIYVNNKGNDENIIVLAGGINEKFYIKNGIIISENEYNVKSTKENIIKRNRILVGLSKIIVIVQAVTNDGVNYIVNNAIEQGREIVVFPSDIFDNRNGYTNDLIKEGVKVVTSYNELLVYEQEIYM